MSKQLSQKVLNIIDNQERLFVNSQLLKSPKTHLHPAPCLASRVHFASACLARAVAQPSSGNFSTLPSSIFATIHHDRLLVAQRFLHCFAPSLCTSFCNAYTLEQTIKHRTHRTHRRDGQTRSPSRRWRKDLDNLPQRPKSSWSTRSHTWSCHTPQFQFRILQHVWRAQP